MTRTPVFAIVLACITAACTTVSASLAGLPSEAPPPPEPAPLGQPASAQVEPTQVDDQLGPLDASGIFAGEVELLVPRNLLALHPFGTDDVVFEFEQSHAKIERQRKIPGPWEGKLVRWLRRDPSAAEPAVLQMAIAHDSKWSLAPAGCDDARNECYVREASIEWLERSHDEARGRAQGLLELASSADEAGPARFMLVTTVVHGAYVYALLYELHAEEWVVHEALVRASADSLTIKDPNTP